MTIENLIKAHQEGQLNHARSITKSRPLQKELAAEIWMARTSFLPVSILLAASLLLLGSYAEAPIKLSHPALTGTTELTLKVLYW